MRTIAIVVLSISLSVGILFAVPKTIFSAEAQSTFAILNQKWLNEFEKKNSNLFLYSLVPKEQTDAHAQDFTATFFTSDSRRLTETIGYIQLNNIWQPRPPILIEPQKAEQGAAANP